MAALEAAEQGDSTANTKKPIRLPHLPAELWLLIGKMAIDSLDTVTYADIYDWASDNGGCKTESPGLALANRAFSVELLPYYYETKFEVESYVTQSSQEKLGKWLVKIGAKNRGHLRGLAVREALRWKGTADWLANRMEIDDDIQIKVTLASEGKVRNRIFHVELLD
ncbi:hypothetical protein PRZ48_011768 [Zasmidium cellare]|uniref:Uncharacterized protein n=1 Tax=Zasmidium cellare TaxID=395010 RepID=A0ABR0E7S7_ZASCE|nr:hypothetical protein PRZ48_011768 [Zasmidium cellare]